MACHGIGARHVWDDWSKTSTKFDPAAQDRKWASFHADRETGVTVASIYGMARKLGWRDEEQKPPITLRVFNPADWEGKIAPPVYGSCATIFQPAPLLALCRWRDREKLP